MIIMKIIKQVELIAAAPKTVPPRLKITLKLTEIPSAAIAIPKNTYAAWTKLSKTTGGNGKKVPKTLVKMKPPKNHGIGNFLGACVWSAALSLTSLRWYQ